MTAAQTTDASVTPGPKVPDRGGQLTHRQIVGILIGLMLGLFLAALDQTIVASAIRTIGDDLHGLSVQAWVTTAYLITATISTPLYGKLSDLYGRKPFFLLAISLFLIGSILCAFATSMYMLAGFRALQGLGAGGLFSLALAILGDVVAPRERAKYQGYFLAVFGTSSVLGPVIGGFFAGANQILGITGWRWVFLVNVPIGLIALVVVAKLLNIPHTRRPHRIDWLGAVSISVCLVPLLTVAEQGRAWGWTSQRALVCYAVGAVGLLVFLWAEARAGDDALIPLRMFRDRTFSITSLVGLIVGMGMFGGIAALPLYLQIVRGATPTEAGLLLIPLTAGIMIGSIVSGQLISRTGRYKIYPVLGTLMMVGGLLLLARVGVDTPFWQTSVYMGVFGFGLGNIMQPITLAVQNAMPPEDIGVATSSATFFRQMGGTLGTAVFLSVLFSTVGGNIKTAFEDAANTPAFQRALNDPAVVANPANAPVLDAVRSGGAVGGSTLDDTSFLTHMDSVLARPFKVGFSDSMDLVFLIGAAVLVLGFLLVLFLPSLPLRTMSGIAARQAASPLGGELPPVDIVGGGTPGSERSGAVEPATTVAAPNGVAGAGGGRTVAEQEMAERQVVEADVAEPQVAEPDVPDVGVRTEPNGRGAVTAMGLSNSAVLSGRVTGPAGQPIVGAAVTVTDFTGQQVARGRTAGDGVYRLDLPTGGSFLLICAAEDHQPAAALVAVGAGEVHRDLALVGAGLLVGRIGRPGGEPIVGATVTLTDARGEVVGAAVAGPDGEYELADLYPGEYTLTASAEGTRPNAQTISLDGTGSQRHDVVLLANGAIVGRVVSAASGLPVREAWVTLIDETGMVAASGQTGEDGQYDFTGLAPGGYVLTASGYAPVAARVKLTGDGIDRHDVALGAATTGHESEHHG